MNSNLIWTRKILILRKLKYILGTLRKTLNPYLYCFMNSNRLQEQEHWEVIQEKALDILHNLSSYQGMANVRACSQLGCLSHLLRLLIREDMVEKRVELTRRVALTLLNFTSEPANHDLFLPYMEQLLPLAWSQHPCARILLRLLSKLSYSTANASSGGVSSSSSTSLLKSSYQNPGNEGDSSGDEALSPLSP